MSEFEPIHQTLLSLEPLQSSQTPEIGRNNRHTYNRQSFPDIRQIYRFLTYFWQPC